MSISKVALLGLDGATFYLLRPWMEDGTLPHLANLQKRGASGVLASTVPPVTPTAWSTCITGVNPGKHGVFDFRDSPLRHPDRPLLSLSSIRAPRLWQLLNGAGKKTVILNVPMTYPPEAVDGCMVSGMMTPGPEANYTYPPELKAEIRREIGDYLPDIDLPKYDAERYEDALAYLDLIRKSFSQREKLFFHLMENQPWDFFMGVFILPDRLQHVFWKYLDPETGLYGTEIAQRLRGAVIDCYRLMDDFIGRLVERLSSDTLLLVMSDHGFGPTQAWINVSTWLEQQGLLKIRGRVALQRRLLYHAVGLNEVGWLKRLIPQSLQARARKRVRQTKSAFRTDVQVTLDWDRTQAFFPSIPAQGIYINVERDGAGIVPPGKVYEALRARLRDSLLALKDPATGERIVDSVQYREEVYHGPETPYAPDLFFVARNYSYLGRPMFGGREVIRSSTQVPNGFHRPDGIFLAHGPHVTSGRAVTGSHIADITPTILYSLGLPVPKEMDGKPLSEIFEADFQPEKKGQEVSATESPQPPEGTPSEGYRPEEASAIEKRLRALGYED
jgi:predicted AlkP superfamily phosphohydrolase/phosphomutase